MGIIQISGRQETVVGVGNALLLTRDDPLCMIERAHERAHTRTHSSAITVSHWGKAQCDQTNLGSAPWTALMEQATSFQLALKSSYMVS